MDREGTVPCKTCGQQTPMIGTKLCDPCYEVESRLLLYLRRGGTRAARFVKDALAQAGEEGSP